MKEEIVLTGVRTHNLKNIDVAIPHRKITVITGLSGSGKSSLAFDTLYAEGRRRYVESLSTYARQFLERIEKPDLDSVAGMLPAIAIQAKNVVTNARSTVGTQTELHDYFRLLYARIGVTLCTSCHKKIEVDSAESIYEKLAKSFEEQLVTISFPFSVSKKSMKVTEGVVQELEKQGFLFLMLGGKKVALEELQKQRLKQVRDMLIVADEVELKPRNRNRIIDSLESALRLGKGFVSIFSEQGSEFVGQKFSSHFRCAHCDLEYRLATPNTFSFNNPLGACPECQGFGRVITIDWNLVVPNPQLSISEGVIEPWTKPSAVREFRQLKKFCEHRQIPKDVPFSQLAEEQRQWILKGGSGDADYFSVVDFFKYLEKKTYKMHIRIFLSKYRGYIPCATCLGKRLKPEALAVKVDGKDISELSAFTISNLKSFFETLKFSEYDEKVAEPILLEIRKRLNFLYHIGLGYLSLDRLSRTLSGGEAQRIHLASSLGSALVDTLYVLDEPSVGLHERDNTMLINLLRELRDLGNTVVVVEHDKMMIEAADYMIDLGPLSGGKGGEITFAGPFENLKYAKDSYTARYFSGEFQIKRGKPFLAEPGSGRTISIDGARQHNLKNISVSIPLQRMVVITGVSGSGKSTLMYDILYNHYLRYRGRKVQDVGEVRGGKGFECIKDILLIDQSPIGRTPRSNPVTYLKAFDYIRKAFAGTIDAKRRHLTASDFSFNAGKGRCEECEGAGVMMVEMHFLADISMTCEACGGTRYQSRVLDVRYKGKNIHEVLNMTVDEAYDFFGDLRALVERLSILKQVGLGYLRLGQSATTLSGGEAQRLKLASEMVTSSQENLLYLFDEPTTGLHYHDIASLLSSFEVLLKRGHSLCIIEHNMEVIKCADYIIDLGPEGGDSGGEVIYAGPLEGILNVPKSYTGKALRKYM